jgi:hypothetical protein
MMFWGAYTHWFQIHYDVLKVDLLESGSQECGPILEAKDRKYPASAPFGVDWAVIYGDGKYFRVKEAWNRVGHPPIGGGVRSHFSYHYGDAHPRRDADGFPLTQEPDTPDADLRIDMDSTLVPHIHINSPDHIPQNRVQGYSISDASMVDFLRAVIRHRKTQEPLHDLLKITVIP